MSARLTDEQLVRLEEEAAQLVYDSKWRRVPLCIQADPADLRALCAELRELRAQGEALRVKLIGIEAQNERTTMAMGVDRGATGGDWTAVEIAVVRPMTPEERADLRRVATCAAQAATGGRWVRGAPDEDRDSLVVVVPSAGGRSPCVAVAASWLWGGFRPSERLTPEIAGAVLDHLAASCPDAVLALLDALDAAEREREPTPLASPSAEGGAR